jgi:hypothetical protein
MSAPSPALPRDSERILALAARSMFELFENASEGMLLIDRDARVVWINEQYRRFLPALGFAREEDFVGQPVARVVDNTQMHEVLRTGKPILIDLLGNKAGTFVVSRIPLRDAAGEVIGVLEYINRKGDPPFEPFTPDEMDRAAIYADAIAAMVNAYNSARLFSDLSDKVLSSDGAAEYSAVRRWIAELRDTSESRERLDLSVLVREVASRGDAERRLCRELLEAILKFSDTKGETSFLSYQ